MSAFLDLHRPGHPLLLPNPWDAGSARILAALGFQALATTSSGFAATLGRPDGSVTRDEALDHAAAVVAAVDVPVSADLENGFADDPSGVADTVTRARATGLAGCSIEDSTGRDDDPIYHAALAAERVAAAVQAAGDDFVITARAENHLHGRDDLADTIARLQSFQDAGAHVLYAPGVIDRRRPAHAARRGRPAGQRAGAGRRAHRGRARRPRRRPHLGRRRVRVRRPRCAGRGRPRAARAGHLRVLGPGEGRPRPWRGRPSPAEPQRSRCAPITTVRSLGQAEVRGRVGRVVGQPDEQPLAPRRHARRRRRA